MAEINNQMIEAENLAIQTAEILLRYGADLNTCRIVEYEPVYPIIDCLSEIPNEHLFAYLLEAGMKECLQDENCVQDINSYILDKRYLWREYPDDICVLTDIPIQNKLCLLMRAYNPKIYTIFD